jgi:hypothetical protein
LRYHSHERNIAWPRSRRVEEDYQRCGSISSGSLHRLLRHSVLLMREKRIPSPAYSASIALIATTAQYSLRLQFFDNKQVSEATWVVYAPLIECRSRRFCHQFKHKRRSTLSLCHFSGICEALETKSHALTLFQDSDTLSSIPNEQKRARVTSWIKDLIPRSQVLARLLPLVAHLKFWTAAERTSKSRATPSKTNKIYTSGRLCYSRQQSAPLDATFTAISI